MAAATIYDRETALSFLEILGRHSRVIEAADEIGISANALQHALRRHRLGTPSQYLAGRQPFKTSESYVPPRADVSPELPPQAPQSPREAGGPFSVDVDLSELDKPEHDVREWATPQQRSALNAVLKHGSIVAAAEALCMTPERLRGHLTEVDRRAARQGWAPGHDMTKTVPTGFHVKGVSSYYGADGELRGQWVKSSKDKDAQIALLLDAMQEIAEPFKGRSEYVESPRRCEADLLAIYPMGDPHFGMHAWAEEVGEDFDLRIAERHLVEAVDRLVSLAPPAEQALVANLGDFFHADNVSARTSRSGHALDVDTRWAKVLAVGIRAMRRCIDKALEKHKTVRVVCEIGNHDDHSSIMLALCLANYYENNPRVEVDTSPSPFHWLRFGKCLIGITHGDGAKFSALPQIMATDRAKDWGETTHRYWYCGHVHHDSVKEFPGCTVETFRTLAGKDAWHHRQGYRAGQDMKLDILHREHGRVVRHVVGVEQLTAA